MPTYGYYKHRSVKVFIHLFIAFLNVAIEFKLKNF